MKELYQAFISGLMAGYLLAQVFVIKLPWDD